MRVKKRLVVLTASVAQLAEVETMPAFLLTWNPSRWKWGEGNLSDMCEHTSQGKLVPYGWSTGNNKSIQKNDKLYLLRQHVEPIGIMASGFAAHEVEQKRHWDRERRQRGIRSNHVDINFNAVIDPAMFPVLSVEEIKSPPFRDSLWSTRTGGIALTKQEESALQSRWRIHLRSIGFRNREGRPSGIRNGKVPEEMIRGLFEGDVVSIVIDRHERSSQARKKCLAHWGYACMVCGMTFKERYGIVGARYIQVHHLRPLASAEVSRPVDPINDLRPVCANCHVMLHALEPPLTISQLKARLRA